MSIFAYYFVYGILLFFTILISSFLILCKPNIRTANVTPVLTIISYMIEIFFGIGFFPGYGTIISILNCSNNKLFIQPEIACWTITHLMMSLFGLII